MEPTAEQEHAKIVLALNSERRSDLRGRMEGRRLERDSVEIDLRAIAQERLARSKTKRR